MAGKLNDQEELKEIKRRFAAEASSRIVAGDVAASRYEATDQLIRVFFGTPFPRTERMSIL